MHNGKYLPTILYLDCFSTSHTLASPIWHRLSSNNSCQSSSPIGSNMFPISPGFPWPWTTNPQRLHFFFLLPASSISWKKPPRLRSTLAITEYKLCTANKTTLFSTVQNMIMVFVDKVLPSCLQCHNCPLLSRVFQSHLAALHLFSLLLPGSFLFLFVFFFLLCMPIINFLLGPALCDPWVFLGAPLGIPIAPGLLINGFSSPATNSFNGIYCYQVQDSISKCSNPGSPWMTLEWFHGVSCSAVCRPSVCQMSSTKTIWISVTVELRTFEDHCLGRSLGSAGFCAMKAVVILMQPCKSQQLTKNIACNWHCFNLCLACQAVLGAGGLASSTDVACIVLGTFDGDTASVLQICNSKNTNIPQQSPNISPINGTHTRLQYTSQ